jgi:hypothetical protein
MTNVTVPARKARRKWFHATVLAVPVAGLPEDGHRLLEAGDGRLKPPQVPVNGDPAYEAGYRY